MKSLFKFLILTVIVGLCGLFTNKVCYRFPTVEEMEDYHKGHYSTEVLSMTAKQKGEILFFRAEHGNKQGFTEHYNTETHRAWVFPWETYFESRARMSDKK
jgi:hypothetical protein